jgi:hypothetical protein
MEGANHVGPLFWCAVFADLLGMLALSLLLTEFGVTLAMVRTTFVKRSAASTEHTIGTEYRPMSANLFFNLCLIMNVL